MSFSFNFTANHLKALLEGNVDAREWHAAMGKILPKYGIDSPKRVAGFVAQCAHESANFKRLVENMNYSEKALLSVFSRYFGEPPKRDAAEYARKPEMIANYVYQDEFRSSKMGNVNEGDGWLFRGRGLIQLTGRDNYTRFGKTVGMTAEEAVEYVATKQGALESACWFWDTASCNKFADARDIEGMSKRINGGLTGLKERKRRWEHALALFNEKSPEIVYETVRLGSRGDTVRFVQGALGLSTDGIFGACTETTLKEWQKVNNLMPDGIAGPKTIRVLLSK